MNADDLVKYRPLPITVAVIPVPSVISVTSPPRMVSGVTAVSASNGVGVGRTALTLALIVTYSESATAITYPYVVAAEVKD